MLIMSSRQGVQTFTIFLTHPEVHMQENITHVHVRPYEKTGLSWINY